MKKKNEKNGKSLINNKKIFFQNRNVGSNEWTYRKVPMSIIIRIQSTNKFN